MRANPNTQKFQFLLKQDTPTWQIAAVVPEPSTLVLGVAALAGLALFVSSRKKPRRA